MQHGNRLADWAMEASCSIATTLLAELREHHAAWQPPCWLSYGIIMQCLWDSTIYLWGDLCLSVYQELRHDWLVGYRGSVTKGCRTGKITTMISRARLSIRKYGGACWNFVEQTIFQRAPACLAAEILRNYTSANGHVNMKVLGTIHWPLLRH